MSAATVDRPCPHERTAAHINVILLEDTGRRQAEIRVWCEECDEPFLWPSSVPVGVDLSGIARSLDGQELRVAIRSGADFPEELVEQGEVE